MFNSAPSKPTPSFEKRPRAFTTGDIDAKYTIQTAGLQTIHSQLESLINQQTASLTRILKTNNHNLNQAKLKTLQDELDSQKEYHKSRAWGKFSASLAIEKNCLEALDEANKDKKTSAGGKAFSELEIYNKFYKQKVTIHNKITSINDTISELGDKSIREHQHKPTMLSTINRKQKYSSHTTSSRHITKQSRRRAKTFNGRRMKNPAFFAPSSHTPDPKSTIDNIGPSTLQPQKTQTGTIKLHSPKLLTRLHNKLKRTKSSPDLVKIIRTDCTAATTNNHKLCSEAKVTNQRRAHTPYTGNGTVRAKANAYEQMLSSSQTNQLRLRANTAPSKPTETRRLRKR